MNDIQKGAALLEKFAETLRELGKKFELRIAYDLEEYGIMSYPLDRKVTIDSRMIKEVFFTVFEIDVEGKSQALADFRTRDEAEALYNYLTNKHG